MPESKETPIGDINGERRTETRLFTNAQVEIAGVDLAGNSFRDFTKVKNFSDVGCQFQTQIPLRCGAVVAIKPLGPAGQCRPEEPFKLFEIVWTARCAPGWLVGARSLEGEELENVEFPPANYTASHTDK